VSAILGGGGGFGGGGKGDKGLQLPLMETLRLAWADPELRQRILFVLGMFAVFVLGTHIPVPMEGITSEDLSQKLKGNPFFQLIDIFGGGALGRVSIFALGLNPYITASIIMQILTTAFPEWKKEMQEGGEYARRQQNRRTRFLTLFLCVFQGLGFLQIIGQSVPISTWIKVTTIIFWTAGAMFILWLGEQISEKGIGNGVSLMIFAGIVISLPGQARTVTNALQDGTVHWLQVVVLLLLFLATTWFIVMFTTAQRRIPIQHMRRQVGTKVLGGSTSYLPLSVNMAGVIPIIFAVSLVNIPAQFASMFGTGQIGQGLMEVAEYLNPLQRMAEPTMLGTIKSFVACVFYTALIFFFTYFYTAIQYNVEDISNNLKRGGSFIPGVRPGKQTKDFLDGVISRITVVGALFLSAVALVQYLAPAITNINQLSIIGGTTLLIMVSVALETMRQIEANLLMKQYGT
jgi:preprotein translocase subunit SecY